MSQFAIDQVLSQIRSLQAAQKAAIARPVAAPGVGGAAGAPGVAGTSFAETLKRGIDQVNATQQNASKLVTAFERGTPGVELSQVMVETQKASVSFRAVTEVRNRFVSAYQEIMNMPI
jgi:flagellar hook-basal body complex protein FliE